MFFKTSSEAQSSCQYAKLVIPNDSVYIMNQSDTAYWGVFYADSQYLTLQLDFWDYNVISNIQLFSGSYNALNELHVQKNPANIVLFTDNLTPGSYYFFKINKTTNNGVVRVRLDTKAPILNCTSGVCNDNISLSCDFSM